MKTIRSLLPLSLFLAGLSLGLAGCVSDGYVEGGVYYGPRHHHWFHDDPWMDGPGWYGGERRRNDDIYIAPPRVIISAPLNLPSPPRLRLP